MIAGIVLAAGESNRMKVPKALLTIKSISFAECIVNKMKGSGVGPVRLVAGAHYGEIKSVLEDRLQAEILLNEEYAEGQISSLKRGLRDVPASAAGVVVWPVDLPLVMEQTVFTLIAAYYSNQMTITIPVHHSRHGHPVLYGRSAMDAALSLSNDQTARDLLSMFSGEILPIEVADPGILIDIDTPEDYSNYVLR